MQVQEVKRSKYRSWWYRPLFWWQFVVACCRRVDFAAGVPITRSCTVRGGAYHFSGDGIVVKAKCPMVVRVLPISLAGDGTGSAFNVSGPVDVLARSGFRITRRWLPCKR